MNDPIDLLENKNNRIPSFLSDKYNPMIAGVLGFGAACFVNFGLRRPILSGKSLIFPNLHNVISSFPV